MASTPKGEYAQLLRKRAGAYIRTLRQDAQLTQQQFAERVGQKYFTMISQVERGTSRLPPESLKIWAEVLNVDLSEFAKKLLSYYEPYHYAAIFEKPVPKRLIKGNDTEAEACPAEEKSSHLRLVTTTSESP